MIAVNRALRHMSIVAVCGILALACAPSGVPAAAPALHARRAALQSQSASPSASPSPLELAPVPAPDPKLMVDTVGDVHKAVIRLEATGDAREMTSGESYSAWTGSGFLIDDNGLAITNAHVAAGADALTAYVDGGTTGVPARIIGFAPCIDVAVIRLAGKGYRWLRWNKQPHKLQRVWAVGHPEGIVETRRTKGKVKAVTFDGPNPATDMQHVIATSVPIKPGSSGSPVVNRDGAVLGVAFGADEVNPSAALAISNVDVQPAVAQIRQDHPAAIGVVGYVAVHPDHPIAGLRVIDVAPGSPAKRSGVQVGDMITGIDGVRVAGGQTTETFCDALQRHTGSEPVRIQVARSISNRLYEADLGRERLHTVAKLNTLHAQLLPIVEGFDHVVYDYTTVTNDAGTLRVEVPSAWDDVDTRRIRDGGKRVPSLSASFDLTRYLDTWGTPGVTLLGSRNAQALPLDRVLDDLGLTDVGSRCTLEGPYPIRNPRFRGRLAVYAACVPGGVTLAVARLRPRDGRGVAAVVMLLRTPRDLEALDHVLDSVEITF